MTKQAGRSDWRGKVEKWETVTALKGSDSKQRPKVSILSGDLRALEEEEEQEQ